MRLCRFGAALHQMQVCTRLGLLLLPSLATLAHGLPPRQPRIVIVPGNKNPGNITQYGWYAWAQRELSKLPDVKECLLETMPDPIDAHEDVWIPFMKEELQCGRDTIIIGHSSGAEAAMRFAERYQVRGLVLVSACVTDMGKRHETIAGYYNRPWHWDVIRDHVMWSPDNFIVQFGSADDPAIPWAEHVAVADSLETEFHRYRSKGHFVQRTFPELVDVLRDKLEVTSDDD